MPETKKKTYKLPVLNLFVFFCFLDTISDPGVCVPYHEAKFYFNSLLRH